MRAVGTVLVVGLVVFGWSQIVKAKTRGHKPPKPNPAAIAAQKNAAIAQLQAQIADAQKVLDGAEKNSSMDKDQLDSAKKDLDQARTKIDSADSEQDILRRHLREIEENLISSQSDDSEFGRARDALSAAKDDLTRQKDRVLGAPDYKAKVGQIRDASDAGRLRAEIRRDALDKDDAYQTARRALDASLKRFMPLKQKLFADDPDWKKTSESLRTSEAEERKLREKATSTASAAPDAQDIRSSKDVANDARATIARAQAKLRQLGVRVAGK
jgi:hypothetical protein